MKLSQEVIQKIESNYSQAIEGKSGGEGHLKSWNRVMNRLKSIKNKSVGNENQLSERNYFYYSKPNGEENDSLDLNDSLDE